jgi:hypothetical protein
MAEPEGPVYYSDGIDPIRRSSPDELFLITIEARPEPGADEYGDAGGAFVNCWVNAADLRMAERRAVALIRDHGWRPHRFEEWELVTRATYTGREQESDGGPDLREVVEQAFLDGEVCVFNTWPVDASDADEDAEPDVARDPEGI